ncbi:nuclear transport factor 2 family protein [Streptomonospora wellingtoniae]|uniref:Nuclear transport factor 2 family protein n=1 Tax=Streptomonospora wellingtoniae TaxID=3075544 RepID=A0ABU2KYI5_9ACTN|nr:nuclear transport factor 2 family protein [Streptomonospora sp. DSM 45055]MDT0304207.1 nuclear transport factor 2 family protein [Streptomonospora sp. DSM 45055]
MMSGHDAANDEHGSASPPPGPNPPRDPDALKAELLDLEHQGWRSLCDGTGSDFYGALMTEDGVMVLAHGEAFDRPTVVASLKHAPPWSGYAITDERLVVLGPDSAALIYRARAYRDGAESAFTALMASCYTRRDGAWRLALYQQTPIPPPA